MIRSLGKMVYGEVPTSFNPLRMLQANPLLLLLLAGGLLTVSVVSGYFIEVLMVNHLQLALPKILTYLDPETMAEVARDQSEMHARVAVSLPCLPVPGWANGELPCSPSRTWTCLLPSPSSWLGPQVLHPVSLLHLPRWMPKYLPWQCHR